MKSITNIT